MRRSAGYALACCFLAALLPSAYAGVGQIYAVVMGMFGGHAVDVTTVADGEVLTYDAGTGVWTNAPLGAIVQDVGAIMSAQLTGSLIIVHSGAASTLAPGTVDYPLVSNGAGNALGYEILAVAGGGTGSATAAGWPGLAGDAAAVTSLAHGELPVGTSTGVVNLAPGTDGQALVSDSTSASGLAWDTVGGFMVAFTAGEGVAPLSTTTAAPSNTTANSGVWSLLFDASTMEGTHFWFSMPPAYDSTAPLNVELTWFGAGAGTNSVVWGVQFACFVEGTDDMDTTAYATSLDTVTYATTAANVTQGIMSTTTYSLTNAEIDGAVAGSDMLLEVERRAAQAYLDNFAADAGLVGVRLWQ